MTTALGSAAGLGHWRLALTGTAIALALLVIDHSLERWVQGRTPKDDHSSEGDGSRAKGGMESGDSSGP
ncbi:MAG: MgtC/SapB family protein [Sphingomonadaceae bacterium]